MEIRNPEVGQTLDLQQKLVNWASEHPERYPSLVLLDPNDPTVTLTEKTKLAQRPETAHITGSPIDSGTLETIVNGVEPRFSLMLDTLERHEQQSGLITAMGRGLEEGKNVIVVANHDNIGNLGFVLAAYICALKNKGFDFQTGTIVGKITPYVGRRVGENAMSLTDVLALGCNDIYLSYPKTPSRIRAGISDEVAKEHNIRMLKTLLKKLRAGGNLMVIDPTGRTNQVVDGFVTFNEVEGASEGILSKPNTLLANTGIWLEDGSDVFTTDGKLYKISKEQSKPGDVITNVTMEEFMVIHAHSLNSAVDPNKAVFETAAQGHIRKAALAAGKLVQAN